MRVVRKMVSTILFLLILCSTFTALPISVGAVETSTPAYVSYQAKRYSDSFQQIFGDGYNSYANTYYRTMKSNEKVVSGIAIWEAAHIATSPTYSVESGLITKEDMYKTAIFDMLDVTESNSFASNLFNILQDSRMSYMFSVAKTVCDEKDIKVEELKNFEVNAEYINFLKDAAKLSKTLNVVDKISKVVSGCSNLYDAVCTMASYQAISDMKDGTKEILTAIANDSENPADLRSAARDCVSAFDDGYGSILSAMENASNPYVQATIKTIMDEAIDTIWGEVISGIPGGKVVFGTVKGMRVLSNEIFKMDDTCRVYYQFEADVTLENAIRKCMNNAKYDYMQDKNQSNAVTYMRAVDMYKRIVLQGYDYSIDMLTVKANAPSTKWFDWFNHSYSDCMEMIDKIEQSKNDRKNLYEQFEDWVHSDYINLYCDNYDDTMNKLNNQKPIYATSVTLTQIKDINIGDSGYIYDYIKKTCVPENSVENKKKYFVADNKDIITLDRYGCFTAESSGQVTLTYDKGGDLETSITINIGNTKTDNTYDYTKEFQYKTNYNEENHRYEVTITKYIGNRSNVIIPYSIDENIVTDIGHDAFKDCTSLVSIAIPDSVTLIDEYAFSGCTSLTSITIPDSIKSIYGEAFKNCISLTSITIPNSVTKIVHDTFYGCTNLTSVTIPDSVTYLGECVFSGCTSLTSITIPDSVTSIGGGAFKDCTGLTSITIPNGVTSIGWRAFEYCKSLTDITLPNSITTLGGDAFCYCTSLTSITIPDSVISIDGAFRGCISLTSIIIPNSVKSIGDGAFADCTSLKNIIISDSVTSIGNGAFEDCTSLTSITIPDNVTDIGKWAFIDCDNLKSVILGDSVQSVGERIFEGCINLSNIEISNSVTSIGWGAFRDCISLTNIVIPDGITYIESETFSNCAGLTSISLGKCIKTIESNSFHSCKKLSSIKIPDSVITIEYGAFMLCESLENVVIGNGITDIGDSAFEDCGKLKSVTLGNSIKSIGENAFENCGRLANITMPNSVTSIGKYAFIGCWNLKSVTLGNSIKVIGENAFEDCDILENITIPNSVTSIGKDAFEYCNNLKNILYSGSKEEWNSIKIGENNSCLTNADIHYNSKFVETFSPTCVEKGYDVYTCSECKDGVKINFVDPLGHNFVNGICEHCGKDELDCIESAHPYENDTDEKWTIHKNNAKRIAVIFSESTETESGCDYIKIFDKDNNMVGQYSGTELSGKRIVVRGDTVIIKLTSDGSNNYYGFSVTDVIPYYDECNHKTSEIRNSKAETCGDDGYTGDLVCTECELVLKKGEVIPATGKHDFEDTVYNATCVDEGYTVHSCKNCDYSYTDSYVDATGEHKYKDGICEMCGRPDIDNLENINGSDTKNIEIENEGDYKYFKFTPEKDGTLKIYSTGTYDTYGYLYDSNMDLLSSNDDGEDSNFSITYDVTAGKTYVIGCKMYSSSIGSFDLVVNFEPNNTYKIGDANGDEKVTVADITVIQKYLANRLQLSEERLIACDVNKDGVVTIEDATLIQKYLIHLVPSLN